MSHPKNPEVERAHKALRLLVTIAGLSRREVRRRLLKVNSGADVSRLLSGNLDLKIRHVLDICGVLGLHPGEFFAIAYPKPPESTAFLLKVRAAVNSIRAASAGQDGPKAG
jgi:hypothetical protein